jgi:hypothetical protein
MYTSEEILSFFRLHHHHRSHNTLVVYIYFSLKLDLIFSAFRVLHIQALLLLHSRFFFKLDFSFHYHPSGNETLKQRKEKSRERIENKAAQHT